MRRLLPQKLLSSRLVKSILIMITGTAGAQALTLAFTPLITRIYSPDAIGEFGGFVAILNVMLPIAALTLPAAIVLPKRDETAARLVQICFLISLILSLLTLAITAVFYRDIANLLNFSSSPEYLLLLPFAMLFAGSYQVLQQWLIRSRQFTRIARISILQSLFVNVGKVAGGLFAPVALSLIIIQTLGQALFVMLMFRFRPNSALVKKAKLRVAYRVLVRKFRQFPLFQMPQQALNAVSISVPVILLSSLFSPAVAGWYTLSRTIMTAPSVVLGRAVGDVYYPQLTSLYQQQLPLTKTIIKGTLSLLFLGSVPFGIVAIWGPELFILAFGSQWSEAGEMSRWIALWTLLMFANPPALKAIMVLQKQHIALAINIVTLTLRICTLFIGAYNYQSMIVAVAGYALVSMLHNIVIISLAIISSLNNCQQTTSAK